MRAPQGRTTRRRGTRDSPASDPERTCVGEEEERVLVVDDLGVERITIEHPRRAAQEDALVAPDGRLSDDRDEEETEGRGACHRSHDPRSIRPAVAQEPTR